MVKTVDPHSWFIAQDSTSKKQTVYNNETYLHNYPFAFTVNISASPSPATNQVTLYNLSDEHRAFYAKGEKCWLAFNWGKTKKILCEGYISKIDTATHDGTTDTQVIYFTEGTDYKNIAARKLKKSKKESVNQYKTVKVNKAGHFERKRYHVYTIETYKKGPKKGQQYRVGHFKYKNVWVKDRTVKKRVKKRVTKTKLTNIAFKKGKTYKQVIQGIASQAGIKISKLQLAKNPKLKKSFTAHGKPLALINQLVKHCGSRLVYVQGKLEIVNPKAKRRSWIVIDDKDLLTPPSYSEDDKGGGVWEITTPLLPDITINSGIKLESKYLKGKYYVYSGQHSSDGTNPQTQLSLKEA